VLLVANPTLLAAGRYIPLIGIVAADGISAVPVTVDALAIVPVTLKLVAPGSVVLPIDTPPEACIRATSAGAAPLEVLKANPKTEDTPPLTLSMEAYLSTLSLPIIITGVLVLAVVTTDKILNFNGGAEVVMPNLAFALSHINPELDANALVPLP
jgi:hypothetical protein